MNNKSRINFLIAATCALALLLLCGCYQIPVQQGENVSSIGDNNTTEVVEDDSIYYDIAETDIFAIENITADQIKVLDMKVGDSADFMLETLGEPDILTPYNENTIFNCEYGESLGLNGIGLILNVKGNIIKRITVLNPFNSFLQGSTKFLNKTKYDIYSMFGTPDRQTEEPMTRIFYYDETGIDILLDGKNVKGISFRQPVEVKEEEEKETLSEKL